MPRSVPSLLLALLGAAAAAAHAADGLKAPAGDAVWPRWQARVTISLAQPLWRPSWDDRSGEASAQRLESLGLLGDYYFGAALSALPSSGFRATSGLIIGAPSNRALAGLGSGSGLGLSPARARVGGTSFAPAPWGTDANPAPATVPYLGLGYSAQPARGGWGFSADIGLVAQAPGAVVRLGRVFNGSQTLDDMLREMRLSPLLNVGVSYSF